MPTDVLKSQSLFIKNFLKKKEYDDMMLQKLTYVAILRSSLAICPS
jgi:hypothetical protein